MIGQPAIVHHVVDTTRAARDWAVIMSEPDAQVRHWLKETHLFEIAKDVSGELSATKHPTRPVAIEGVYGSISIVVGDREIVVVANLMTRTGRVDSDERTRGAA
jgi:hypothetical protein